MKKIIMLMLFSSQLCLAGTPDYWTKNKTMNLPKGIATTSCSYYNSLDLTSDEAELLNELYKRWMKGWVGGFAMYSDWDIRKIDDSEYINFLKTYCQKFPKNTIAMAAHTFTFRVKK